jgi:CBS domain-containing protein
LEEAMKVEDIMTAEPKTCQPSMTVAAAVELMRSADCGFLPVVDQQGDLVGVVTDRDISVALAQANQRASELTVGDVASKEVYSCRHDDDVSAALAIMREHHVRRLPIEGYGRMIVGVISMNDIVLAAGPKKAVRNDQVIDAMKAICAHSRPSPRVTPA